ncbi:MAG: hypothetical protein U1E32_05920 [Rhodoglobus sp.]|nr:hypothetical protein [Rhodoglobus sp.]
MNEDTRPTIDQRPRKPSQSVSGVLALVALLVSIALQLVRIVIAPERLDALILGAAVALGLVALVFGWLYIDYWVRSRRLRGLAPDALVVPFTVTDELVHVTMRLARRLDSPGVQLGTEKVATLAVGSTGIHVMSAPDRPIGHIPGDLVVVAGFGSSTVGVREFASIVLRVTVDAEDYDLPIVPANPKHALSVLSLEDLEQLAGRIRSRLAPRAV